MSAKKKPGLPNAVAKRRRALPRIKPRHRPGKRGMTSVILPAENLLKIMPPGRWREPPEMQPQPPGTSPSALPKFRMLCTAECFKNGCLKKTACRKKALFPVPLIPLNLLRPTRRQGGSSIAARRFKTRLPDFLRSDI